MNIEDQITALLAEAEPLRCLPQDDPAALPLAGIVDEINRLRAIQAVPGFVDSDDAATPPKRKPGRPKATPEGADA